MALHRGCLHSRRWPLAFSFFLLAGYPLMLEHASSISTHIRTAVFHALFFGCALLFTGCQPPQAINAQEAEVAAPAPLVTGAERLVAENFAPLSGKRVGLIANHTAMVGDQHLADLLHEAVDVELVALFGPEHGLRGDADAGEKIEDGRDDRTGVPIYSLYGQTQKPSPTMLEGMDVLVFDIQDIGSRFYTYISTMGLAMEAAAEQNIAFMVLDRPNPLGGTLMEGFIREAEFTSFVGQFPIPVTHGLTVGELARMVQGENMMVGLINLDLTVVEMTGWERGQLWPVLDRSWIKTSPNIPDFETALLYAGACFFEGTTASEGRGTQTPFRLLGAPWGDSASLADTLNARGLPGVQFEAVSFTPQSISGMSSNPKLQDTPLQGVRYVLTDVSTFRPVETGVHVLHAFFQQAPDKDEFFRERWLNMLSGNRQTVTMLQAGARPEAIAAAWQEEVSTFQSAREPYLLY